MELMVNLIAYVLRKFTMIKTHTQKDGTIWEWEETKELIEILKKLNNNKSKEE